jgi:hypothetical protein
VAHLNVKAIESHLESAHFHYVSSVLSFAKDIVTAGEAHGRKSSFWVDSGLCKSKADAVLLFEAVDSVFEEIKAMAPEDLALQAYKAHGRLLTVLSNLRGTQPEKWPDMPYIPTFESKHAPYAPVDVPAEASAEASSSRLG